MGKSRHGDRRLVMHACLPARRTLGCLDQEFAFWVDMKHLKYLKLKINKRGIVTHEE
jgi:hypothetical protein